MAKVASVIGGTGLIGKELVEQLANNENYSVIKVFLRCRIEDWSEQTKIEQIVTDFRDQTSLEDQILSDDLYICIGTTLKKAGSKINQQHIDLDLPLAIAEAAKRKQINQVAVVSSVGAAPKSASFYLNLKGKLEQGLKDLNFEYLVVVRPSVLLGKRNEFRFGEFVAGYLLQVTKFIPFLRKYQPIKGAQVAKKMIELMNTNSSERTVIIHSPELQN